MNKRAKVPMNTVLAEIENKDYIPNLPQKRRLSSTCWERNWSIQFEESLSNPHSIHDLASNWSRESVQLHIQLRTPNKICCVMRMEDCCDQSFLAHSLELFRYLDSTVGSIQKIEDRASSSWFN